MNGWVGIHAGAALLFVGAWYFGWLTRRSEYSFGMQEIVKQGIARKWSPFSSMRHYQNIAKQFRGSKGEIRMYKLRDLFPGSTGSRPERHGSGEHR